MDEKLAEGGQAEIFAATLEFDNGEEEDDIVVKVFKGGSVLQDLEKQFPPALLKYQQKDELDDPKWRSLFGGITSVTLLRDESFKDGFAFVIEKMWGDCRS